jgi:hypothetical protein
MEGGVAKSMSENQKLSYYRAFHDIANQVHAAEDINEILINLKGQILSLFDADRITIYVVDGKSKEIYSRFSVGNSNEEIRVPITNKSIAGYAANNAEIINIANAYDLNELKMINKELTFDMSWDERSGYKTKHILTVPVLTRNTSLVCFSSLTRKVGTDSARKIRIRLWKWQTFSGSRSSTRKRWPRKGRSALNLTILSRTTLSAKGNWKPQSPWLATKSCPSSLFSSKT